MSCLCGPGAHRTDTMLRIRDLEIKGGLVLAPMAGYTDSPFRRIALRHGASLVFTELVSAEGILRGNRKTLELLRFGDHEHPLGVQIFGCDPEVMARAAARVEEMGPDLIDLNMGCCAPKICGSGAGAALLRYPERAGEIAAAVVGSVRLPVSAKIRIGWNADSRNYLEMLDILQKAGISMLSVHGRTRAERFSGEADWESIREIARTASIPIVGNGDIESFQDARSRLRESGCAAVMIGRGAVGHPWIFSGRTPSREEIIEAIRTHLSLMLEFYGEYGLILMRKHVVKYIRGIKNAARIRTSLLHAARVADFNDILEEIRLEA